MKAVILVGGQGTRLRPLTCNIPKAIVPLLNRPYLEYLLSYLKKHGVNDIVLAMGYNPEPIKKSLGDGSHLGVHLSYVVEDVPLGTAGAVKNAASALDDTFIVFNGDILTELDLSEMVRLHKKNRPEVSIALTPVENPTIYGVVETDSKNRVQRFVEKPPWAEVTTNMINAGVYIVEPEILNKIPPGTRYMFEHHLFPGLLREGSAMLGYKSDEYWIDIGTPQKYLKAHHDLMKKWPGNEVKTEGKSQIHSSAFVEGPVVIGDGCIIEAGARILGPTVVGPGCRICQDAVIESSVLWGNSSIGGSTRIRDCVIGSRVVVENQADLEECVVGDDITIKTGNKLERGASVWPEGCDGTN